MSDHDQRPWRQYICLACGLIYDEEQGDPDGGYVGAAFKNAIFAVDTSRPVTANSEDSPGDTLTHAMDVNSFSYNYGEYDAFHLKYVREGGGAGQTGK